MPKTTPAAKWCLFRDHPTLLLAIKKRMADRGLKQIQVAETAGLPVYRLNRYLNKRKPNLNQYQLYTICQKLGLDIKLRIEFK